MLRSQMLEKEESSRLALHHAQLYGEVEVNEGLVDLLLDVIGVEFRIVEQLVQLGEWSAGILSP